MRNKYKIIVVLLFGIILFIVIVFFSIVRNNNQQKIDNVTISNNLKTNWDDSICDLLYGKIGFNNFPLSHKFLSKYNSINDLFSGKVKHIFENDYFESYNENMENILTITIETGRGYEQIAYQLHYVINENNELDDIEILDSRVYKNSNGEYLHYDKYHYYFDDPKVATDILCFPYRNDFDGDPYRVYVTKSFTEKFPDCQDDTYLNDGIVGDKDYLICGEVIQDNDQPNICYVEFLDIDWTKTYKITFDILDNGYINDATIELYKKELTKDPEYVKELYEGYKENVRWF